MYSARERRFAWNRCRADSVRLLRQYKQRQKFTTVPRNAIHDDEMENCSPRLKRTGNLRLTQLSITRGISPNADYGRNQIGGTRSVASIGPGHTATTERGPPDHPKTCAHSAHKLRSKRLMENTLLRAFQADSDTMNVGSRYWGKLPRSAA